MKKIISLLVVFLILVSCAYVPTVPQEEADEVKKLEINRSKANIYLIRVKNYSAFKAVPIRVNGKFIGKTAPNTFMFWAVNSGVYEIKAESVNGKATLSINAKAGTNYYIEQDVNYKIIPELKIMDLNKAKELIKNSDWVIQNPL